MENPTLREIIEVEKEIQQTLEHTKEKMRAWIEIRKKEADEELVRREAELLNSFQQARENEIRDAGKRTSSIVAEAEGRAARLTHLDDDILARIAANHIKEILPG